MKRLLLASLLALAVPATASADSIVYIDQGNVWSATPDGARKVQLTTGGGWHSPTQADDGTIAAVQGTGPISVLARDGRPLRTIATPPARSADGGTFAPRPVQLAFSPDGTKIAYAYTAYSCPPASSCGSIQRSTLYTDASGETPISKYGNQFSVSDPSWVSNTRTLVFGGYGSQVSIDDLGPGDYSQTPWMVPDGDMGDGELSRDGRRLAVTFDYGANKRLGFFAVSQAPPAYPDAACSTTAADARYASPSWSPDGSGLAYESSGGIEITHFTRFEAGACATANDLVLSATGSAPDWGPADPPAAAYVPAAPSVPSVPVVPVPAAPAPPVPVSAPFKPSFTVGKVTAKALRKGLVLKAAVPAGRVTLTVRGGGRTLATGGATAKGAGTVTIRLPRVKRARKGVRLTFKLSFKDGALVRTVKVA
ncbi:MAG TPA: hypothetical protein VNS09_16765 [Solirubrobacter sp.]|nr:hypothetical protein [Solirubrobacter sp.]